MDLAEAAKIDLNVKKLALASCLVNISSIIVVSLSPDYLSLVLGLTPFQIGLYEGLAEFAAWVSRLLAGYLCDLFSSRYHLLLLAFLLIVISRPLWVLTAVPWVLYLARAFDRLGNGLASVPRDALVGEYSSTQNRGTAFGFRQGAGFLGSALGAVLVLYWYGGELGQARELFTFGSLAAFLAIIPIAVLPKDRGLTIPSNAKAFIFSLRSIRDFPASYWRLLILSSIVALASYNVIFLAYEAQLREGSMMSPALVMIIFNSLTFMFAWGAGHASDRYGPFRLLQVGIFAIILANFVLIFTKDEIFLVFALALWALQSGVIQNQCSRLIVKHSSASQRGLGFGLYYLSSGISLLFANSFCGYAFEAGSLNNAFILSLFIAGIGFLVVSTLPYDFS